MSGFPTIQLGEVTTKVGSGSTPRGGEAAYKSTGTPLIRSMNVHFDGFREDGLAHIDDDQAAALRNVEVRAHDVLLNITGASIGRVTIAPPHMDGARVNQHVCIIRPDHRLEPSFLRWFLASPHQQRLINSMESGATRQALTKEKILAFEVPLPSLDGQREIVADLEKQFSRLDEAVANLQRVKANLKLYRATVLQSAVDGVLIQSTSNFPEVPLQELIGRITQGWSPKCDLNREALPNEWAIITTTAVQPMQYLDNQGKPLPADLVPRPGIEIKNGDFLMTRKGPRKRAGVACLVRSTRHRLMVCDTVYRFRCDESKILPDYLEIALNAPKVVDAIDRHKAGISESGVSLTHDKLGSVLIPLPSREAQAAIVAEVDRHLSIIREVEAEVDTNLQRAQALRQATLARAFSSPESGGVF